MGVFSILPEWLSVVETWVARLCFLLAVMTIGPWLLALLYDLVLYIFRTVQWELYGRHRGDRRPRAPSLTERPDGHRRHISLPGIDLPEATLGAKATAPGSRQDVACASSRAPSHFPQGAGS